MGIGISGITSGMDTDSIVEALVATKTAKKESLQKEQTKLQWKQDAWKTLNTKIYNFYTKTLSDMRLVGSYTNKKTTSVSNPNVATVTSSSGSVNGTQTLKITQLAKAGYLTGAKISAQDGSKITSSTTLGSLGITDSTSLNISIGGKESVIELNGDMKVSELVQKLKDAGVNANFDEKNQRFFVSAKESGLDNDFSITSADGKSGIDALKNLGLYTVSAKEVEQYKTWSNYSAEDIQNMIDAAYEASKTDAATVTEELQNELERLEKENESLTATQKSQQYQLDYAKMYINKTADERNEYYSSLQERATAISEQLAKGTDESGNALTEEQTAALLAEQDDVSLKISAVKTVDKAIGADTLTTEDRQNYVNELEVSLDETNATIASNTTTIQNDTELLAGNKVTVMVDEDGDGKAETAKQMDINDIVDSRNSATKTAVTDQYQNKYKTAQAYMTQYNYNTGDSAYKAAHQAEYEAAVAEIGDIKASASTDGTGAVRIDGQNAVIELNGARFENSDNTITVNGLSITAQELTGNETVSITTKTDSQGVYDMIKNFFKEYNSLINEMDKLYNADSARGYEPLTDDEKESLSDKEIEKYEDKIKDSLLRRDTTLGSLIQMMKTTLAQGTTVDGKKSYLSDYGVSTLGYLYAAQNERGAYHIDGDSDDSATSSKTDKLMAAILEDPDQVAATFSGIATSLYDGLYDKMKTTTMSSVYTVYNDKQMKEEYNKYTTKIAEQETKISWWEDYYRSKFTAMEKMLSSLNQQQSSLSGLFG